MRIRGAVPAAVTTAAVLALSGCSGFLVPAGEGEPAPGATADARAASAPPVPGPASTTDAPAQGAPTPAESTGACPASGVSVDMGPVQTVMFHRAVTLTLTNCGKRPYRVHGYPSVRALGDDGERIPVPVNAGGSVFGNDEGPEETVLKPGARVTSTLAWVSTQEGGDLIEGDALEISAAPDTGARVFPLEGHDIRLMDELNTTAWRTGEDG
ncbi:MULTISPECIES: DUF4232 domain-containing protein [unclassified Streptomyces]|uniref:DUF4232 domain-containing protein n=1 Tax=unclassified Streptomyces TaxID=2593676 RepID=UPI000CD4EA44|nr:DUF4232 domain-containing protein [Streptomyces sp. SM10]